MKVHATKRVKVWADIDLGVADFVKLLQTYKGVTTHASCQGTIGEGGPHPYRAQVMCSWTLKAYERLRKEFDITLPAGSNGWGYVHPPILKQIRRWRRK